MKNISILIGLVLMGFLGSCKASSAGNNQGQEVVSTVAPKDFDQQLTSTAGAQLIDVRTPEEYASGHLKNAININVHGADFESKIKLLSKEQPVFVYCRSGGRSATAADKIEEMGFRKVYNMDGGITSWSGAGLPIVGSE
jgi:rhodanese-related sulfurtransferase